MLHYHSKASPELRPCGDNTVQNKRKTRRRTPADLSAHMLQETWNAARVTTTGVVIRYRLIRIMDMWRPYPEEIPFKWNHRFLYLSGKAGIRHLFLLYACSVWWMVTPASINKHLKITNESTNVQSMHLLKLLTQAQTWVQTPVSYICSVDRIWTQKLASCLTV